MTSYPYAGRFPVNRTLPEDGRPRDEVLAQLQTMAQEEDAFWETGKCSGTMYCGDHDHYGFLNEAFGLFAHVNVLQRDMCPSATKFEGEIIAMALDLFHADAVAGHRRRRGLVTTGGTGSILHAVLAYREHAGQHGGHPAEPDQAGDRPSGVRQGLPPLRRRAAPGAGRSGHDPGRRRTGSPTTSTTRPSRSSARPATTATAPSTRSRSCRTLALERGVGLHVDGCLGGFILPFGAGARLRHPVFDFRLPGVTSISADTHKYGYAFKGTSVAAVPRQGAAQRPVLLPHRLERRQVLLAGHRGVAFGRPAGGHLGGHGAVWAARATAATPSQIFDDRRGHAGRRCDPTRNCASWASPPSCSASPPTSSTCTTSTTSCGSEGMAAQRPAVPQRPAHGGDPAADPARGGRGVRRRSGGRRRLRPAQHAGEAAASAAPSTAGVAGGMTDEADDFIRAVMADMLDSSRPSPPQREADAGARPTCCCAARRYRASRARRSARLAAVRGADSAVPRWALVSPPPARGQRAWR